MRKLSRKELIVLFCIWIAGPVSAIASGSPLASIEYAADWALALTFLGACLYVTASVSVGVLGAVSRARSNASGT